MDERTFRDPLRHDRQRAAALRRAFAGLDVRVAFTGGDARLMYEARVPVAIEAETGLTDAFIARQALEKRGRVGHEKVADLSYLVGQRGAHFTLRLHGLKVLKVRERLPLVEVRMGAARAFCLHWDAELMARLRRRGAVFRDFTRDIDAIIAQLDRLTDLQVRVVYEKLQRFYFDHNDDPIRERPLLSRLSGSR